MARRKVSVIGAGNVGATAAQRIVDKQLADVVLVDIVAKRVPTSAAVSAIGDMLQRGAPERQFVVLRSEVEQDIIAGRPPESALLERTRAHLRQLDADPLTTNPASRRHTPP